MACPDKRNSVFSVRPVGDVSRSIGATDMEGAPPQLLGADQRISVDGS